jgi:hypothetical protein
MAQLSRPYQLGLLGVVLLAAVWLVLIQGHSSSSTAGSGSSAPAVQTVTTTTAVPDKHAKGKIYHGAAPGVGGLTSAVAKAEGAVSTSQQNANAIEQKSAAASNEAAATTHSSTSPAGASTPTKSAETTKTTHVTKVTPTKTTHVTTTKTTHVTTTKTVAPNASTRSTIAVNQRIVEAQLHKGKVAVILFWDPRGSDDVSVRKAVSRLSGNGRVKVAVNYARANQVASFGTITRGIQVYGTPTLLVVNKNGQTITLTGLQDSFAIEQAISEARHA